VKDFKTVCKLEPQNKDAREKYQTTLKEHKEVRIILLIFIKERVRKMYLS